MTARMSLFGWTILIAMFLFVPPGLTFAAPPKAVTSATGTALILDTDTRLDCNQLEMFIYNDGNFAYDDANVLGKTSGLYFPRGTKKTVVYAAGLWVGAKVNGEIRLAVAEYSAEYVPGPMENGSYMLDSPAFRVYKVNRGDTDANPDYANWPIDQGAPVDEDGHPLIYGDQMLWSVFNDADSAEHVNDAAQTAPLGIEVQLAAFGFARSGALGNAYFLKYTIINKGGNQLDSTYSSIWVDPDIGDADHDFVGCDSSLSLGYCYNDGPDVDYGSNPPAVGIDLLQGPIVPGSESDTALLMNYMRPGYRNLPLSSFVGYINGTDPSSSAEAHNYMQGLQIFGDPIVSPDGDTTTFMFTGDPVTGEGWIEQLSTDQRMMLSVGPFDMAPGDTQEVVVAVMVGQGASGPVSSILEMRAIDAEIEYEFEKQFHGVRDCGDVDGSMFVIVTDAVYLINYIFASGPEPVSGTADVNCDGKINITDAVYLINYIFATGPVPCAECPR